MLWILPAVAALVFGVAVGLLAVGLVSRRTAKRDPRTFPAKLRVVAGAADGLGRRWPRWPTRVRWVHDVVIVHRGIVTWRRRELPVAVVAGPIVEGRPADLRHLGPRPIRLALVLDDKTEVELAAPADAREAMVGPFLAVLVADRA